jgi:hypothetical protein
MGNVDEFKRLHLEYSAASLACVGGPYDEHGVLCQKALDAEQALIEWVEKREAKIVELEAALEMCLDFCQGQAGSYPHDCAVAARKALGR